MTAAQQDPKIKHIINSLHGHGVLRLRRPVIIVSEVFAVVIAYLLSFQLRYEFSVPPAAWELFWTSVPVLMGLRAATLWYWKLFAGLWRYVTIPDVMAILKANLIGSLVFLFYLLFWFGHGLGGIPRSVLVLEFLLSSALLAGMRVGVRVMRESWNRSRQSGHLERALIVGASDSGLHLAREMLGNPLLGLYLVGFVDDDDAKQNLQLLGRPVLGRTSDLPWLIEQEAVTRVMVAVTAPTPNIVKRLRDACAQAGAQCSILPPLNDILLDRPLWKQAREISSEDLMGREVIGFQQDGGSVIHHSREGETILVSGAAGSIGSEICRQLAGQSPGRLILLDQNESGLYDLQQDLLRGWPELKHVAVIGDIVDQPKIDWLFATYRPTRVYHTAAYKHVPLMEAEPVEALRVNVLGSHNLGMAALAHGVRRFTFISTDKAVNPISVMGMTKLAAEYVLATCARNSGCRFMTVRFGNVINSNGSVIPLFRRQVEQGGPVTVTHPEITRFFMAIEEAVSLVLAAGDMGQGGEIFLLDMGQPVRILDVAHQVIRTANLLPERDIEIRIIGLRPGEKLHEELYWVGEGIRDTGHPQIKAVQARRLPPETVSHWLGEFRRACAQPDGAMARQVLKAFVETASADNGQSPGPSPAPTAPLGFARPAVRHD